MLHHDEQGSGPALVMLHGGGPGASGASNFGSALPRFAESFRKRALLAHAGMQDNLATHFTASFLAGFVATTICSPVDVIKTRIMSASDSSSIVRLLTEIYRNEGLGWMFRGWVPSFIRLGPHTIATFLFLEQHKKIYRHLHGYGD